MDQSEELHLKLLKSIAKEIEQMDPEKKDISAHVRQLTGETLKIQSHLQACLEQAWYGIAPKLIDFACSETTKDIDRNLVLIVLKNVLTSARYDIHDRGVASAIVRGLTSKHFHDIAVASIKQALTKAKEDKRHFFDPGFADAILVLAAKTHETKNITELCEINWMMYRSTMRNDGFQVPDTWTPLDLIHVVLWTCAWRLKNETLEDTPETWTKIEPLFKYALSEDMLCQNHEAGAVACYALTELCRHMETLDELHETVDEKVVHCILLLVESHMHHSTSRALLCIARIAVNKRIATILIEWDAISRIGVLAMRGSSHQAEAFDALAGILQGNYEMARPKVSTHLERTALEVFGASDAGKRSADAFLRRFKQLLPLVRPLASLDLC